MIVHVRAPSRLHFGFLSLPAEREPSNARDEMRLPARRFGGAGLMIRSPGMELTVEPAPTWSARDRWQRGHSNSRKGLQVRYHLGLLCRTLSGSNMLPQSMLASVPAHNLA